MCMENKIHPLLPPSKIKKKKKSVNTFPISMEETFFEECFVTYLMNFCRCGIWLCRIERWTQTKFNEGELAMFSVGSGAKFENS